MENSSILELTSGHKILFLLFLGQCGAIILFNWIRKTIYLIKKDVMKFIYLILGVSFNFFLYNYLYSDMEFYKLIESSIYFIPLFIFIIIDFCIII